jgi:hypothetical protein
VDDGDEYGSYNDLIRNEIGDSFTFRPSFGNTIMRVWSNVGYKQEDLPERKLLETDKKGWGSCCKHRMLLKGALEVGGWGLGNSGERVYMQVSQSLITTSYREGSTTQPTWKR